MSMQSESATMVTDTTSPTSRRMRTFHFAMVPKLVEEPFFDAAAKGCQAGADELSSTTNASPSSESESESQSEEYVDEVHCHYVGYPIADATEQAKIIKNLIKSPQTFLGTNVTKLDGLAVAVLDEEITGTVIESAIEAGIPVITYDSDAPQSRRLAHISTDNYAFGQELGKVLDQLRPRGGQYGIITGFGPNLIDRVRGLRDRLNDNTNWVEVSGSPKDCENNITLSLQQMYELASDSHANAIIPVGGWPMFDEDPTRWKEFVAKNRHVTTVVADSVDIQLELMNQGFVDGLVGQLPHQIGVMAANTLYEINQGTMPQSTLVGSHLLEIMRHPLVLPQAHVNENYLGNLAIMGYILFGIVALQSVYFLYWTYINRMARVVRVSQPLFMSMICVGSLILASSLIPLSIDDGSYHSQRANDIACQSIPWLITLGFATAFSALSSKTWRVVKILHNAQRFERIQVSVKDVIQPYMVLMIVNIVVLLCWTIISPLTYKRQAHLGTDDWNRIISTYGQCQSSDGAVGGSLPYFLVLSIVNIGLLVVANIQAYRARSIHTEFSESRYVAIVMASMLQTFFVGLPMLFLVYDQPQAFFIVMCVLIFVTCMAIQLFMFVPKILVLREWKAKRRAQNQNSNGNSSVATDERMKAIHMGSSVLLPHLNQRRHSGGKQKDNNHVNNHNDNLGNRSGEQQSQEQYRNPNGGSLYISRDDDDDDDTDNNMKYFFSGGGHRHHQGGRPSSSAQENDHFDVAYRMSNSDRQNSESRYSVPYERSRVMSNSRDVCYGLPIENKASTATATSAGPVDGRVVVIDSAGEEGDDGGGDNRTGMANDNSQHQHLLHEEQQQQQQESLMSDPNEWAAFFASMMRDVPADRKVALIKQFEFELGMMNEEQGETTSTTEEERTLHDEFLPDHSAADSSQINTRESTVAAVVSSTSHLDDEEQRSHID